MFLKEDIEELEEFEHLEHEEALKNNCAEACRMLYYRVFVVTLRPAAPPTCQR